MSYMAPELTSGRIDTSKNVKKFKYNSKVDIWALGITIYQMVLLQVPSPYSVNETEITKLKEVGFQSFIPKDAIFYNYFRDRKFKLCLNFKGKSLAMRS